MTLWVNPADDKLMIFFSYLFIYFFFLFIIIIIIFFFFFFLAEIGMHIITEASYLLERLFI